MAGTTDTGALGKHPPPQWGKSHDKGGRVPSALIRDCPERGADDSGNEQPLGAGVYIKPWHDLRRLEADLMSLSPYSPTLGQTRNRKHPTNDIMPRASPGNGLMMSTRGSHMTIYYK